MYYIICRKICKPIHFSPKSGSVGNTHKGIKLDSPNFEVRNHIATKSSTYTELPHSMVVATLMSY